MSCLSVRKCHKSLATKGRGEVAKTILLSCSQAFLSPSPLVECEEGEGGFSSYRFLDFHYRDSSLLYHKVLTLANAL